MQKNAVEKCKFVLVIGAQILIGAALVLLPLKDLFLGHGVYNFFLSQPRVQLGSLGAILLLVLCLITSGIRLKKSYRISILIVIGLLYLRLTNSDVALFTTIIYAESLAAIGSLVLFPWRKVTARSNFSILAILCGFGIGGLLVAAFSVVNLAEPLTSFLLIIGLGLVAALICRTRPLIYNVFDHAMDQGSVQRMAFSCILSVILVMSAKTSLISDYDSLWYGLRTQYVLAQGGSIFANLGLNHFVYYYPKLYETLILPLCFSGVPTFPASFNIFVFAVIAGTAYQIAIVCGGSQKFAWLAVLAVGLTSITGETAMLVKPDLITAAILLIAFLYTIHYFKEFEFRILNGCVIVSALCIALAGKLTSIPFGGALAICILILGVCGVGHAAKHDYLPAKTRLLYGPLLLVVGLCVLVVFCFRTYHLTGLPYIQPGFLANWFSNIGFKTHLPYLPPPNSTGGWHFKFADLDNIVNMFFRPSRLPHIVAIWTGNQYVLTIFISLLVVKRWANNANLRTAYSVALAIFIFSLVFVAFYGRVPGGDGNYYVFPIIAISAITATAYEYLWPPIRRVSVLILLCLLAFHTVTWFVTSPMWEGGIGKVSMSFMNTIRDQRITRTNELKINGLSNIAHALKAAYDEGHCTALAGGDELVLFELPCGVEGERLVLGMRSAYMTNVESMSQYIAEAHFDFIIIPKNGLDNDPLSEVFSAYSKLPGVIKIDDILYMALDLRHVQVPLPVVTAELNNSLNGQITQQSQAIDILNGVKIIPTSEIVEPWRQSVVINNVRLNKYLYGNSMSIRNGATAEVSLSEMHVVCPTSLYFRTGLSLIDQVRGGYSDGLHVDVINGNTHDILVSKIFEVPNNGFEMESMKISRCDKSENPVLQLHAISNDQGNLVSVVVAAPMFSLPVDQDARNSAKKPGSDQRSSGIISNKNGNLGILKFGPSIIKANTGFNVQRNGESALWILMDRDVEGKAYIVINGTRLSGVRRRNVVTVAVPAILYSKPGSYPMYVLEVVGNQTIKSNQVDFIVH